MSNQANDYASIWEKHEINLMGLQPVSSSEPICCTLRHVKISGIIKYEALFYLQGEKQIRKIST
jgi:hypothetical protein